MPQVGGHLIIAEKVMQSLGNPAYLQQNRNAYNLGAIGPDMPFFLFDRIEQLSVLNTVLDVYQVIKQIKDVLDEAAAAILNPAIDLGNWFTGHLLDSVDDLISLSVSSLQNLILMKLLPSSTETVENPFKDSTDPRVPHGPTLTLTASDLSYLFRRFGHPYSYDNGYKQAEPVGDYRHWWWTDVLHYRRTGPFAERLVDLAQGDPMLSAYATGYWTHVGADVTGHPYVNSVVGGAYREHVIRHMMQENIVDTWLWNHYKGEDIIRSKLHRKVDVGGDIGPIIRLLLQAMIDIYDPPGGGKTPIRPNYFPGCRPTEGDLERAYQTMLLFLELSTDCGIEPPVPPPGSIDEVFEEVWNDIVKEVEEIGESFGGGSGGFSWWKFLLALLAPFLAAMHAVNVLIKLVTLPEATLIRLATLAPRWAIYKVQCLLYEYVINARWQLALSGFGRPSKDDLVRPFCQLATRIHPQRAGFQNAIVYPAKQVPRTQQAFWLVDPLAYPNNVLAQKGEYSPYAAYAEPSCFVDGAGYPVAHDASLLSFAAASSPAATVDIETATFSFGQFGNAVDFSKRLIDRLYPPASFDLDADFGYGFLSWDGITPYYVE